MIGTYALVAGAYAGPFVEFSIEPSINEGGVLYSPPLEVQDGRVRIPNGFGWAVVINPEWLAGANHQRSEQRA